MEKVNYKDFDYKNTVAKKKSDWLKNIIETIHSLSVDESVLLRRTEWRIKTTPNNYLRQYLLPGSIRVRSLKDDSGWVITKIYNHPEIGSQKPDNYNQLISDIK